VNGFAADNYSTFNLRRKQQKKTQAFYEPPNEWSSEKRSDRPRVNFVHPDDSKGDDENWRAHKANKVVNAPPKVVKKIEEKPVLEKIMQPVEVIPSMVINTRVSLAPVQNISEKAPGFGNRKREEKKVVNKTIPSGLLMAYEKLPPRFRKKFCEENHITIEEVESYLSNGLPLQDDHSKQHSSFQSRSQTLPPRSGKSRSNEPQRHHDQIFYRTNINQLPPKTEMKRIHSTASSTTELSRRVVDFDLPTKIFNSHQESKTDSNLDSNTKDRTDDKISVNLKQSLESAVLFPSGTIVSSIMSYLIFVIFSDLFIYLDIVIYRIGLKK